MEKRFDCIVCGSCVADVLVRPVSLSAPVGAGSLHHTEPIEVTVGGIVSNAGIALARLGMRATAFSYIGDDLWGANIRKIYVRNGLNDDHLMVHPTEVSSTSVVLIDPGGERSFLHCQGAPRRVDRRIYFEHLDLFAGSRMMLLGYYSVRPSLDAELDAVFSAIRATGCRTALDAAGDGGALKPLDRILPHVDVYVPSLAEAEHQTGRSDPQQILETFRNCGAPGLLGVKLGRQGALLSPTAGEFIEIPCLPGPGPMVDTTGAGDSFYAGLLTGLLKGFGPKQAGLLAAATGACCVTGYGSTSGLRNFEETARLAGIS